MSREPYKHSMAVGSYIQAHADELVTKPRSAQQLRREIHRELNIDISEGSVRRMLKTACELHGLQINLVPRKRRTTRPAVRDTQGLADVVAQHTKQLAVIARALFLTGVADDDRALSDSLLAISLPINSQRTLFHEPSEVGHAK